MLLDEPVNRFDLDQFFTSQLGSSELTFLVRTKRKKGAQTGILVNAELFLGIALSQGIIVKRHSRSEGLRL
jgi:hypothetical protein